LIVTAIEITNYVRQLRRIELSQMNQIGSFCNKEMFLSGSIEDGPTLKPFNTVKEYIIEHLQWAIQRIQTDEELFQFGEHLIKSLQNIIDQAQKDSDLSNSEIKYHLTHTDLNSSNILVDENTGKILAILDWERCAITFNNQDIEFYSRWFENNEREKQFVSLLRQQQEYLDLIYNTSDMQKIDRYLNVMYPAMYATFYSCTWFENEQTVIEHIKRLLKETEDALIVFNDNIVEDNK
jgi:hypothetical protein